MKKLLYDYLLSRTELTNLITNRLVEASSLSGSAQLARPFVVYTMVASSRSPGHPTSTVEFRIYQDRGNYDEIAAILRALRSILSDVSEQSRVRADGSKVRLVEARWEGDGPELFDDLLQANIRSSSYLLIGEGQ